MFAIALVRVMRRFMICFIAQLAIFRALRMAMLVFALMTSCFAFFLASCFARMGMMRTATHCRVHAHDGDQKYADKKVQVWISES